MRINYNVTGADRKALVRAMVELLGEPPVYQGAPSFAYAVGGYQVSKDGMVSVPEDTTPEDIRKLVELLRRKGFQPDVTDAAEAPEPTDTTEQAGPRGFPFRGQERDVIGALQDEGRRPDKVRQEQVRASRGDADNR